MGTVRAVCRQFVMVITLASSFSFGLEKYWLPDLEWQTASNWLNGRVPEIDSHVIFPLETRHAVGIAWSSDLKLSELDLARSGALVLPRDGKLELSERQPSAKLSKWKKEGHFFWADPENWNASSEAAPHFERVPCRRDDVVLPGTERTFSVLLPITDVAVRSVKMSNQPQPFTRWQWDDLQYQREFDRGRFTVRYSEYSCEKCQCQDNAKGDYLEEICAIERPRCGLPSCEYPLTVEGHCCPYCGGRVSLPGKVSLPLAQTMVSEALEGYGERVSWHVRRTWSGAAEVLFKEKGAYSGIDIVEAVERVKTSLLGAEIEVLSTETAGAAMQDSRLAVALGPLFGAPLVILLALLVGFLYFGYSMGHILSGCREAFSSVREGVRTEKAQSGKPFGFARFENVLEGNVQIADAPGTSEQRPENQEEGEKGASSGGRFENPLYRSKRKREDERQIIDLDTPLSLNTLKEKVGDHIEEVEMDIDE